MDKKFGEFMRKLREDRKLTLRQVEERAKISNAYISQIERGDRGVPNFKTLTKLAEAYGVDVAALTQAAEDARKGEKIKETPDVQFVSRGYERLPDEKKKILKDFLQYLMDERRKGRK